MQGGYLKYGLCYLFSTEIQVNLQPKELSLDTATNPWLGHLKFEHTIQGKKTKYGVLVKMVCEAVASGHICQMKIYAAEGQKMENSIITFKQKLRPESLPVSRHFHNRVRLAEILHKNKT